MAWLQDRLDAITVGYSRDGGESWDISIPPTTPCTNGPLDGEPGQISANDPWLSFGPDGILYLSTVIFQGGTNDGPEGDPDYPPGPSAILVNRSLDGGESWVQPPSVVDSSDLPIMDITNIVADPDRPGYAYVQWTKFLPPAAPAAVANPYVSHTEDGGATWSEPVQIPSSRPDRSSLNGKFLVLEDGTLLNIISEVPATPPPRPMTLVARRSSDLGRTWSEPTVIAEADPRRFVNHGVALTPDRRTVYVSWQTCTDSAGQATPCDVVGQVDHFRVMYSRGTVAPHGTMTWQTPAEVSRCSTCVDGKLPAPTGPIDGNPAGGGPFAASEGGLAAPAIAVTVDGTGNEVVGVAFYDHRDPDNPTGGGARRTTHYWLRHSHDGGATWEEQKIAGSFDKLTAPDRWLGDYQGIAPIDGGFATSFVLARPNADANFALADPEACPPGTIGGSCTDLFYSSIAFPVADLSLSKSGPSGRVPTGRNMTYTLTVANNGPDEASEVTAIDQLPASVSFVSAAPSQGSCGESAGIVTCALGQMANGATATVSIVVRPTVAGTITNTASVSAFEADPNEIDNTDSVDTSVCRITSRRSSIPCG